LNIRLQGRHKIRLHNYLRHLLSVAAVCSVLLLLLIPTSKTIAVEPEPQNTWRTTEFEMLWHIRGTGNKPILISEMKGPALALYKPFDTFLRQSFSHAAVYYKSNGISGPYLPLKKGKDGVERWQVHAYGRNTGTLEGEPVDTSFFVSGRCEEGIFEDIKRLISPNDPLLVVKVGDMAKSEETEGVWQRRLYSSAAHELFHAIQSKYDIEYQSRIQCSQAAGNGFWPITEGSATAAEALAFENRFEGVSDGYTVTDTLAGAYPYYKQDLMAANSPHADPEEMPYLTSSFWRYLADTYGGLKVFDFIFKSPIKLDVQGPEVTSEERYKWLDRTILRLTGGKPLYLVYPEFYAELASYPASKFKDYLSIYEPEWLNTIFLGDDSIAGGDSGCRKVVLNKGNFGIAEFKLTGSQGIGKNGAICIELEWSGLAAPIAIGVEAIHPEERVLDQLHLGVARLDNPGSGFCADWVTDSISGFTARFGREFSRKDFDCSFGKNYLKIPDTGPNSERVNYRKDWSLGWPVLGDAFFNDKLEGSGEAVLILSNVAVDPAKTTTMPSSKGDSVTIRFSERIVYDKDGRRLTPPTYLEAILPLGPSFGGGGNFTNISLAGFGNAQQTEVDRYSFYGLVRGSRIITAFQGQAFATNLVDDPEKRYYVTPADWKGLKLGKTGPVSVFVWTTHGPSSGNCRQTGEGVPNANITRSDEYQLRFEVLTDLCVIDRATGRPRVAETMNAEFVVPFGYRYFKETEPRDVLSPGTELYIDEFLRDSAILGIPIPPTVLLSDGSYPGRIPTGKPGDNKTAGDGGGTKGNTSGVPDCKCTCEEQKRVMKALEDAKKSKSQDPAILSEVYCMQKCARTWASCPKN